MVVNGDTAHCEYCGTTFTLDTRTDEQKEYEANRGRLRAQSEYEEDKERRNERYRKKMHQRAALRRLRTFLLVILFIGGFIAVSVGIFFSIPEVDSFEYLTVNFSGTNGNGNAEVVLAKYGEYDLNDFDYELSKFKKLSNGEKIKLTVKSSVLDDGTGMKRAKDGSKVYEVKGLQEYVTDANALTEENLKQLSVLDDTAFGKRQQNEKYDNRERYGIYCRSNGKISEVCDLYKVSYLGETIYSGVLTTNLYFKKDGTPVYDTSHVANHWLFYTLPNNKIVSIDGYKDFKDFILDWKNNDSDFVYSERIF